MMTKKTREYEVVEASSDLKAVTTIKNTKSGKTYKIVEIDPEYEPIKRSEKQKAALEGGLAIGKLTGIHKSDITGTTTVVYERYGESNKFEVTSRTLIKYPEIKKTLRGLELGDIVIVGIEGEDVTSLMSVPDAESTPGKEHDLPEPRRVGDYIEIVK